VAGLCLLTAVGVRVIPAGAAPKGGLPPGLQPTEVNVTNDLTHRYGERW
jgi:hypothetical protein